MFCPNGTLTPFDGVLGLGPVAVSVAVRPTISAMASSLDRSSVQPTGLTGKLSWPPGKWQPTPSVAHPLRMVLGPAVVVDASGAMEQVSRGNAHAFCGL